MSHSKKRIHFTENVFIGELMKRDKRIHELEEENKVLYETIDEYVEMVRDYEEMVGSLNKEIETFLSPVDFGDESDGFYTDADCMPGEIKMQYKRSSGDIEFLTPKTKKRFEGIKMHITPGQGFGIGIVTKDVPR